MKDKLRGKRVHPLVANMRNYFNLSKGNLIEEYEEFENCLGAFFLDNQARKLVHGPRSKSTA
jgi:hypothetical protein